MSRRNRWNIWRIRNRWLRSLFTLVVMTVPLVLLTVAAVIISAASGAAALWRHFLWGLSSRYSVGEAWRDYWRAVTLRRAS